MMDKGVFFIISNEEKCSKRDQKSKLAAELGNT
jgi:hypothetical protein